MKNVTEYLNVINSFGAKRILIIGDLILDVYLKGSSCRLCPEAPVPVVDVAEKNILPGGAANTVCNLKALGASVAFCTAIGLDQEGDEGISLLQNLGLRHTNIIRDPARKTITKSRVISGSQVITRIDQGSETPVGEETTEALIQHIEDEYANCDAVIISDYDKGVITAPLIDKLIHLQERNPKFIAVDSKRLQFFSRLSHFFAKGGDYAKAKLPEAEAIKASGGEIVFLDYIPRHSTSRIINRIHQASKTMKKAFNELLPDDMEKL